jgi:hypothetical protein
MSSAQNSAVGDSLTTYWQTRPGLYVHETFSTQVLPFAHMEDSSDIIGCSYFDLPYSMFDSQIIRTYLGGEVEFKKRVFTPNQIKKFIDAQWNGEDGSLLTNGVNVFYVIGAEGAPFVVNVVRENKLCFHRWCVDSWYLCDGARWEVSKRIFQSAER